MKKNIYWFIAMSLAISVCQSCQKNNSDPLPIIPGDTTVTFLPSSITYTSVDRPDDNIAVSFFYSPDKRTIKVYADDPATASPYDNLARIFYYTDKGYLEKTEDYYTDGKLTERFVVERDNANNLQRVLVARDDTPLTDTFRFSFRDSAAGYTIMNVKNSWQDYTGNDVEISVDLTFLNEQLIWRKEVYYLNGVSSIASGGFTQSYDASDKLLSIKYDAGNEADYSYETTGIALDSFYHFLGGKDGRYISTTDEWPTTAYQEFYFYPLFLILPDRSEPKVDMHRHGIINEVHSLPADVVYNFQNTFDSNQRITETKIMKSGLLTATWKVNY